MNYFEIVGSKMITFAIFMAIGAIAVKIKVLKKDNIKVLSQLIVKIAMPCLVFDLIYAKRVTIFSVAANWRFALIYLLCMLFLCLVGKYVARAARVGGDKEGLYQVSMMIGNSTFIGVPLIVAIFPNGEANAYVPIFAFMGQFLLWTLGVYILGRDNDAMSEQNVIGRLMSPVLMSILLAITITSLNLYIPDQIASAVASLGGTCSSWALIYLGATLCFIDIKSMLQNKSIFLIVLIKMILMPVAVFYVTAPFLDVVERLIVALLLALPTMASIPMAVEQYGGDSSYVAQIIFVTTLLCMFTTPAVCYFIS